MVRCFVHDYHTYILKNNKFAFPIAENILLNAKIYFGGHLGLVSIEKFPQACRLGMRLFSDHEILFYQNNR